MYADEPQNDADELLLVRGAVEVAHEMTAELAPDWHELTQGEKMQRVEFAARVLYDAWTINHPHRTRELWTSEREV